MYPILFSLGPIHIFSFSLFLILAWLVFSFLFWRGLRANGVVEERIFDLTFYATLTALVGARLGFVLLRWELFRDVPLKIAAIWVQPGLSLYGGLLAGILTLVYLVRHYKVRLGLVLDTLVLALPAGMLVGEIGSLLDGSVVGKITLVPWAIRYVGQVGRRHPVQTYEIVALALLILVVVILQKRSIQRRWPFGLVSIWFFGLYSLMMFTLEFFKDSSVYWISLSANQWILIGFFGEALGAFYVRGGGREVVRPALGGWRFRLIRLAKEVYAKLSQRCSREHP